MGPHNLSIKPRSTQAYGITLIPHLGPIPGPKIVPDGDPSHGRLSGSVAIRCNDGPIPRISRASEAYMHKKRLRSRKLALYFSILGIVRFEPLGWCMGRERAMAWVCLELEISRAQTFYQQLNYGAHDLIGGASEFFSGLFIRCLSRHGWIECARGMARQGSSRKHLKIS